MRNIFYEFDPILYPIKLWIAKNPTTESLVNTFKSSDDSPLNLKFNDHSSAQTYNRVVVKKDTLDYGVFILLHRNVDVSIVAHESNHAARIIWDWLREGEIGNEADAYLVGWIADCCWKVKTGKV